MAVKDAYNRKKERTGQKILTPKTKLVDGQRIDIKTNQPYKDNEGKVKSTPTIYSTVDTPTPIVPEPVVTPSQYEPQSQEETMDVTPSTPDPVEEAGTITDEKSPVRTSEETLKERLDKEYDMAFKTFNKASQQYMNGALPLTSGEKAQIDGLKQSFGSLIEQQKQVNASAQNTANIRGYQTGSAEYDPTFQNKVIGSIFTEGQHRVADLNIKMSSAVAEMTQAFQDNKYSKIKEAYENYKSFSNEKKEALQKTIDATQKAIEEARKEQEAVEKEQAISKLYNSGTIDVGQIQSQLKKLGMNVSIKDIGDTVALLSGVGGSGVIGEYNFYSAQARQAGQVPMSFIAYQNEDANRKKSIARAGVTGTTGASGTIYTPAQEKVISSVDSKVANSPVYKKITSMRAYADNVDAALAQGTGVGDIAAINQFQKVIDEGAVTRDQDVKLIQGAQSLANQLATKLKKLQKGEQLSPELRQQMKKATADILVAQEGAIQNDAFVKAKKNELVRNGINPQDSIFGELEGYSSGETANNQLLEQGAQAKTAVINFIQSKPNSPEAKQAISLANSGKSQNEIYEWLKLRGLVQ